MDHGLPACLNTARRSSAGSPCTIPLPCRSPEDLDKLETRSRRCVRAMAYDMVLDGNEVGGGSIRINDPELQERMFEALGLYARRRRRTASAS